jgi:hypothetical protein
MGKRRPPRKAFAWSLDFTRSGEGLAKFLLSAGDDRGILPTIRALFGPPKPERRSVAWLSILLGL